MKGQVAILIVVGLIVIGLVNGTTICVDKNGNDGDSCGTTGDCCLTIQKAVSRANDNDEIQVTAGSYTEYVAVDTKQVSIYGPNVSLIGGFQFSGDISGKANVGAVNISGFAIFYNESHSPLSFATVLFNVVHLHNLVFWNDGHTNNTLHLVDFTNTQRVENAVGTSYWSLTFKSYTNPEFSKNVNLVSVTAPVGFVPRSSSAYDFDISIETDDTVPVSGNFERYNVKFNTVANSDPMANATSLTFAQSTLVDVSTITFWPALDLTFNTVSNLRISVGETNTLSILNCKNVTVEAGNMINFSLFNVNDATISNVDSSNFSIGAYYNSSSSLTNINFLELKNSMISVVEQPDGQNAPTTDTFSVSVHNSLFNQPNSPTVIYNPYGTVYINATKNFFGVGGPQLSCNPTSGTSVSTNVWIYEWCEDSSCSTHAARTYCDQNGLPPTTTGPSTTATSTTGTTTSTTTTTTGATTASTTSHNTTGSTTHEPTTGAPHDEGIGGGGIAGIIIGVLAAIILIGVIVWYFKFKNKQNYVSVD